MEIFDGVSNTIKSHRVYNSKFSCDLDLSLYPFDKQLCQIVLQLNFVGLYRNDSIASYTVSSLLLEYEVGDVSLVRGDNPLVLLVSRTEGVTLSISVCDCVGQ